MARIILKKSSVASKVPSSTDLEVGELAINLADAKLYSKDASDNILDLSASTSSGDMTKAVYDTTNNGKVDLAEVAEAVDWSGVTNKPSTFTPSAHTHVISDVTNLQTTLDGKEASGTAASLISTHEGLSDPHPQYTSMQEIATATGDIHGIVDKNAITLTFSDATRVFTATPTSGSWTFYHKGTLYTVSSAKTLTLANTSGSRFIYINPTTLELVEGGSVPDFVNNIHLAYIYYDTSAAKALIIGDERHGSLRDTTWHSNQHLNVGTVWRSGGGLTYTLDDPATVNLSVGTPLVIADEDLLHTINHSATPTANFEQILSGSASIEVLYLNGTTYTSTAQSTSPWVAGTSLARYNLINAGSGSLVDATEGSYITYWLLATNDIRRPVKLVLGRTPHSTLDLALAEDFVEYGLSFAEQVFMHQIVVQTSSAYTANPAKIKIAAVRKILSKVSSSLGSVSATIHNNLTGRDSLDAHTIGSITGLQTALDSKQSTLVSGTSIKTVNSTSLLGSGDVAVQPTLVSGTNIKTINGSSILGSGDLVVSGGSGSPGGATTNIQYNDAGAFAGSANFTYDASVNTFSLKGTDPEFILGTITNEPASPAASHVAIYAKSIAGRILPKWKGPSGFDTPFQALIAQNKIAWWNPPGNANTVPGVLGIAAPTALGTATARNVATTNAFTRARRLGYNSASNAGNAAGHYSGTAQYTVGTGTGLGGFYYVCRFGSADTLAQAIMFVGLSSSTAAPTVTASPATFTNSIGVGCATGDTNLSIYYGGSAAQTPIALGASFPAKTNSTDLYELVLFAPSNANNVVGYRVQNITTGVMAEGTLTAATAGTQLPASTTLLAHRAYRSNNATATAVLIDIVSVYIETDT